MRKNVKEIADYTEKTWFLGTDLLEGRPNSDLYLMDKGVSTSFVREEGAIYAISEPHIENCINSGYSAYFVEIMREAKQRGYAWVFFDRDIETL